MANRLRRYFVNELTESTLDRGLAVTEYFRDHGGNTSGTVDCAAAVMAAIDDLGDRGGRIIFPGRDQAIYKFEQPVEVTANKRIVFEGDGALIQFEGIEAFHIQTGSLVRNRRQKIEGLRFDGEDDADSCAVALVDTNWFKMEEVTIEGCGVGFLQQCEITDEFVEGTNLDSVTFRDCDISMEFERLAGTTSFGQHSYRDVSIAVKDGGTGMLLPSDCSLYRSSLEIDAWTFDNAIAFDIDGSLKASWNKWFIEAYTGGVNSIGIKLGANAQFVDRCVNLWSWWSSMDPEVDGNVAISNPSNIAYYYQSGRRFYGQTTTAPVQVFRHGVAGAFVSMNTQGAGGGNIDFGNGTVLDGRIQRLGADSIGTPDSWTMAGPMVHTGSTAGFFSTAAVTKETGVAVTAAAIHAALVRLGLIGA